MPLSPTCYSIEHHRTTLPPSLSNDFAITVKILFESYVQLYIVRTPARPPRANHVQAGETTQTMDGTHIGGRAGLFLVKPAVISHSHAQFSYYFHGIVVLRLKLCACRSRRMPLRTIYQLSQG